MPLKKDTKKDHQEYLYTKLINSNIPQISSRFIAMRLQELDVMEITAIRKINTLIFYIYTPKKKYSVHLHQIDLPDAKVEEI